MAKKKERKEINSSTAKQKLESLTADISLHIEPNKKKKNKNLCEDFSLYSLLSEFYDFHNILNKF